MIMRDRMQASQIISSMISSKVRSASVAAVRFKFHSSQTAIYFSVLILSCFAIYNLSVSSAIACMALTMDSILAI